MMKKLLSLLVFSSLIYASSSYEIASKLVNDSSKDAKLRLLFPSGSYMQGGMPNIKAITQVLKMNSLLTYAYNNALNMQVKFRAKAKAGIFLKAITLAYEQIGINYYLISEYSKNNDEMSVAFTINSKFSIDPGSLYEALRKTGVYIVDAKRNGNEFSYELDFSRASIQADFMLNSGSLLELSKPLDSYFIKINNVSKLIIDRNLNNIWYPKIEFLDKNLNLISTYKSDKSFKELNLAVPKMCAYIIVGDAFTLENIKLGLNIKGM